MTILSRAQRAGTDLLTPLLLLLLALMAAITAVLSRRNAQVVQDRVIRAEENFRHFLLTGKPLDGRLTLHQVIALRFASDPEFLQLAAQAAEAGMKPVDIKKAVKAWRPDVRRV